MIHNPAKCPISSTSIAPLMSLRVLSWLYRNHSLSSNVKAAMLLTSYFRFHPCNLKLFLWVLEKKNKLNLASVGRKEAVLQSRLASHPIMYRNLGRVDVMACSIAFTTL